MAIEAPEGNGITTTDGMAASHSIPPAKSEPLILVAPTTPAGRFMPPKQILYRYSPDEWEEFVYEWARALGEPYVNVEILGGSNDGGIDVAAFLSQDGLRGQWDCYQCKHYKSGLVWSQAWPEMFKIFRWVAEGRYTLPRRYRFVAPKGCGKFLARTLQDPPQLKADFLGELASDSTVITETPGELLERITELAKKTDFSRFKSENIDEVIDVHSRTREHVARFGTSLGTRPEVREIPAYDESQESRYVGQLLNVYRESYSKEITTVDDAMNNPRARSHLTRQREYFFSAESLRLFARDSVPVGTFEGLQGDVYDGVFETYARDFTNSMDRLTSVLEKSTSLALHGNVLLIVTKARDSMGICHQLANEDRLKWRGEWSDDDSAE
ncbi:ABC-three component system protein [Streptomyces sp. NPDC005859]|uniref:ABC-three component system protein n=1 Tax=Streptomyces sp. NPDC005859 TaxID=3157170 RepID=UPI0033C13670